MTKYYILVKRKGAKNWIGAIPAKTGVTLSKLRTVVRKSIKKGMVYKIVSETTLKKYLKLKLKQQTRTRASRKTRVVRRKRRKR